MDNSGDYAQLLRTLCIEKADYTEEPPEPVQRAAVWEAYLSAIEKEKEKQKKQKKKKPKAVKKSAKLPAGTRKKAALKKAI